VAIATLKAAEKKLRAHGLAKTGAYEEFPWGDRALKVAKKLSPSDPPRSANRSPGGPR
jgi:hypothetical protein